MDAVRSGDLVPQDWQALYWLNATQQFIITEGSPWKSPLLVAKVQICVLGNF